ncbi:MAG: hypothetical protein WC891_08930 [Actinomycetota bacterium]
MVVYALNEIQDIPGCSEYPRMILHGIFSNEGKAQARAEMLSLDPSNVAIAAWELDGEYIYGE